MLTKPQTDVYNFLVKFKGLFGYMPTSRDIQAQFGYRSQTAAMNHLKALQAKGYISRSSRKARAISIIRPLHEPVAN